MPFVPSGDDLSLMLRGCARTAVGMTDLQNAVRSLIPATLESHNPAIRIPTTTGPGEDGDTKLFELFAHRRSLIVQGVVQSGIHGGKTGREGYSSSTLRFPSFSRTPGREGGEGGSGKGLLQFVGGIA